MHACLFVLACAAESDLCVWMCLNRLQVHVICPVQHYQACTPGFKVSDKITAFAGRGRARGRGRGGGQSYFPDPEDIKFLKVMKGHSKKVTSIAINPDAKQVCAYECATYQLLFAASFAVSCNCNVLKNELKGSEPTYSA